MGDVIGDLSSRRGKVEGMEQRGNAQVVRSQVPLAEMFGYATDLRSRTQGRATYTMQFDSLPASAGVDRPRDRRPSPRRVVRTRIRSAHDVARQIRTDQRSSGAMRHGEGEVRADEAAFEHWDDWSY